MKKTLALLTVFFFTIFLVSCELFNKTNNNILKEEMLEDLYISFQEGDSINKVTKDITLVNNLNLDLKDLNVYWVSDSNSIKIEENVGIVSRTNIDVKVSIKATVEYKNEKLIKYIILTVLAEDENKVLNKAMLDELNITYSETDSKEKVTTDLLLDTEINTSLEGIHIYWESSNSQLIKIVGNEGIVSRGEYNERVYLTVYIQYENEVLRKTIEVVVVGTSGSKPISNTLDIFYINDLHGGVLEDYNTIGLSKMANLILDEAKQKDVLFIAGGDILQGEMFSNYYEGASTIDILNDMQLDAFVIGNHEFDWGLDKVLSYFNGKNSLQANYPLLGANVLRKDTNQRPEGIDAYTIVNKNGKNIAIIGVIGDGLESSIDASLVSGYKFSDAYTAVKNAIDEIKSKNLADHIIVVNHNEDAYFNNRVSNLDVDAIFNGHTHQSYIEDYNGVPVMQSKSDGEYLGYVKLNYNEDRTKFTSYKAYNLSSSEDDERLATDHPYIKEKIDFYFEEIADKYETLLISEYYYDKDILTNYISKAIRVKTDADIAFHNSGGTRDVISRNEEINEAKLLKIFPFDNLIVTVYLKGSEISKLFSGTLNYDIREGMSTSDFYNNPNKLFRVTTHSYIFNFTSNPFMYGQNIKHHGLSLKEVLSEAFIEQKNAGYKLFNVNNPIIFNSIIKTDTSNTYLYA